MERDRRVQRKNGGVADLVTLYEEGCTRKLWSSNTTCAKVLKVDRKVLGEFLRAVESTLTQRRQGYLHHLLKKMQKALAAVSTTGPNDDLIAGRTHVAGQEINGIRFVLTVANFQSVTVQFTDAELEDTDKLIDELNRRFTLIAQSDNRDTRRETFQRLGKKIDELFLNANLIRKVVPIGALKKMEDDREQLAKLRGE